MCRAPLSFVPESRLSSRRPSREAATGEAVVRRGPRVPAKSSCKSNGSLRLWQPCAKTGQPPRNSRPIVLVGDTEVAQQCWFLIEHDEGVGQNAKNRNSCQNSCGMK